MGRTRPLIGNDRQHTARIITQILTTLYPPVVMQAQGTPNRPAARHAGGTPSPHPTFAFLVHPLAISDIYRSRPLRFARALPQPLVERLVAYAPPVYLARIRGIRSAATGEEIAGLLYSIGTTPVQMLRHPPEFTYRRLVQTARSAARRGARLLGLGAFTSVVGDAGVTVAQRTTVGITSGNTLTVVATLETIETALAQLGRNPAQCRVAVIGATGSIGAACARMLATHMQQVWLIAPRPERLHALHQQIRHAAPHAQLCTSTDPNAALDQVDVVILTTSSLSDQVIDVQRLQPGAVVCDVARPPNINQMAARQRPDVLFIESGEIRLPGQPDIGFDIALPPGSAYACLAETALLALEHRYGDYTVGRVILPAQVHELAAMMRKHGLQLTGLHSFGQPLRPAQLAAVRDAGAQANAGSPPMREIIL